MFWQHEFVQYANDPFGSWPAERPLQGQKLVDRLSALTATHALDRGAMLARLVREAELRTAATLPTLFLINCGSSGSHWIEAMLSELPGVHACGEVYVPPTAQERLPTADAENRAGFLNALHLLHLENPAVRIEPAGVLINSAHSWGPHDLMGSPARAAFLLRDPADIVLSRTFRKPRLRRHLQPTASDAAYMEQNIVYVEKFYRTALRRKAAIHIRYEDALIEPAVPLAMLAELLGIEADRSALELIGRRYAADRQRTDRQALSNLYRGPRQDAPDRHLEQVRERDAE